MFHARQNARNRKWCMQETGVRWWLRPTVKRVHISVSRTSNGKESKVYLNSVCIAPPEKIHGSRWVCVCVCSVCVRWANVEQIYRFVCERVNASTSRPASSHHFQKRRNTFPFSVDDFFYISLANNIYKVEPNRSHSLHVPSAHCAYEIEKSRRRSETWNTRDWRKQKIEVEKFAPHLPSDTTKSISIWQTEPISLRVWQVYSVHNNDNHSTHVEREHFLILIGICKLLK